MTILEKANTGEAAKAKNPAIAEYRANVIRIIKLHWKRVFKQLLRTVMNLKPPRRPRGSG